MPALLASMGVDNRTSRTFRKGVTVLAGYYGAENFGHHIHDNWSRFESLRLIGIAAAAADKFQSAEESMAAGMPSHLLLARDCDTYDYAHAGGHKSRNEFVASCHAHEARFFPLSNFASLQSVSLGQSACFEYMVAGDCDEKGRIGYSGRRLPLESVWDFRNSVYTKLNIPTDQRPASQNILIVVKTSLARFPQNHASLASAEALAQYLRASTGLSVDVAPIGSPSDSIKCQVELMINYTHIVLPGGGAGFIAMLAPLASHILIAAYDGEMLSLEAVSCFARLTPLTIANRSYDNDAVLAAVRSPPDLAACDLDSYKATRSHFVRLP